MSKSNYMDRSAYFRIIDNPDVGNFLADCEYLTEPSDEQINQIRQEFTLFDGNGLDRLPENIIAIDSDMYESSVRKELPYTNVGYVKVASCLLKKSKYVSMSGSNFIDPFNIAKITKDKEEVFAVLPCSNMSYKGQASARDSFRLALEDFFAKVISKSGELEYSLRDTLFWLSSYRENGEKNKIKLFKCPTCEHLDVEVLNMEEKQFCIYCGAPIYATDCLRIYEAVQEEGISNRGALGRLRVVLKHIYFAHLLRNIKESNRESFLGIIENIAFIINGTLSIAGQPAWISSSIMKILNEINVELLKKNKPQLLVLGLPEEGNVRNFAEMIQSHIDCKSLMCVSDDFRNMYIDFNRDPSSTTFGAETYYGQDFIYKSQKGKIFVFDLPYPFPNKNNKELFKYEKSRIEKYIEMLNPAIQLIDEFDCDLQDGKIVPIVLSERYTSISLEPGTTVLDILSKMNI